MEAIAKKIVIFLGVSDDFKKISLKQFLDGLLEKRIGSALYNINDINFQTDAEEILGTYSPDEVVICCFRGVKCDQVAEILKKLSLTVIVVDSVNIADCGNNILEKFKS